MPARFLSIVIACSLVAALSLLPAAPAPAQGQYEGYDLVVLVSGTYTILLGNQREAEPGLYTYTGKMAYAVGEASYEGYAAAIWYPDKQTLTLAVKDKDGATVTCSFDEVPGSLASSFSGSYFYLINANEAKKVTAVIVKGSLP